MHLLSLLLVVALSPNNVSLNSLPSQPTHAVKTTAPGHTLTVTDGPEWPPTCPKCRVAE